MNRKVSYPDGKYIYNIHADVYNVKNSTRYYPGDITFHITLHQGVILLNIKKKLKN